MKVRKAVRACYGADGRLDALLYTFREMVNWAMTYALQHHITSRFKLRNELYRQFRERYGCHSHWPYSACEVALSLIKNRKRRKAPVARHLFLKLDNQAYRLKGDLVSIPFKPSERIELKLQLSPYHRRLLKQARHLGSLTLTPDYAIISVDKPSEPYAPRTVMAFDTNERSLDGVTSNGNRLRPMRINLSEAQRIHESYLRNRRGIQARLSHNERRQRAKLARLRGKERRRVDAILHKVSRRIVDRAKRSRAKIVLEDLNGLKNAFRKGKASKNLRRRLNTWSWGRLHQFIKYKADWAGVPIEFVRPAYTSRSCPMCGCRGGEYPNGQFRCICGWSCDRQLNAALNILKRSDAGSWFSPERPANEVMTDMRAYGGEAAEACIAR